MLHETEIIRRHIAIETSLMIDNLNHQYNKKISTKNISFRCERFISRGENRLDVTAASEVLRVETIYLVKYL